MNPRHRQDKPLRARAAARPKTPLVASLTALLAAAALVASLAACGGAPKTPVDHEGLRDRADQETDQL
ncbi:MAG: hypothetical protein FJ138_09085 [Deltaproteobacteria bacterium]|nr:hypothetical protein [Deltaproteobacteria bacterium]